MLADELDYVVGVDTHQDEHVLAVLTAPTGAITAGTAVRSNTRGYREALRIADQYAPGSRAWPIEGTGSYGAGLARYLAERRDGARGQPHTASRAPTPRQGRLARRSPDSASGARQRHARLPRAGERREALRLLLVARRSAVDVRREALTQLRGVIVTAPDRLREQLRGLPAGKLLNRCSRLRRASS